MRKVIGWAVALGLLVAAPVVGHEKRTDRCGCHHQYGLRHCHPNKKTRTCEAPAAYRHLSRKADRASPSKEKPPATSSQL